MEKLSLAQEIELFASGDVEAVKNYLQDQKLSEDGLHAFIEHASTPMMLHYLKSNSLPQDVHLDFVARNQKLFAINNLKPMSPSPELLLFIKRHGISKDVRFAIFQRGVHEEIMYLAAYSYGFEADEELALIKRGNSDEILSYIRFHCLSSEGEQALITRRCHQEIMTYLRYNFTDMPSLSDGRLMIYHGKKSGLSAKAEALLLQSQDQEALTLYIERTGKLNNPKMEEYLLLNYPLSYAQKYIKQYTLSDEAKAALICSWDPNYLVWYVNEPGCHLSTSLQQLLVDRGVVRAIIMYDKVHGFDEGVNFVI